ncbi:MAG: hypothetical protein ACFFDP_12380 [Promethearchaeota archaeon]
MKLGEILSEIIDKRISRYGLKYAPPIDKLLDAFLPQNEINQVSIESILVLVDQRPRSLVSIAYALRFAQALKANLLAITKGVHHELIQEEAKQYSIAITSLVTYMKTPPLGKIEEIIQENNVGLVILHNLYENAKEILESSSVPVLIIKVGNLVRSL